VSGAERCLETLSRLPQLLAGLDAHTPVLLGFSGGADSSALLHWLAGESRRVGFSLTLCHLDHGIRGEEAERDRRFCERIAQAYGLEIVVGCADVPSRAAEAGQSIEEAARAERYAFFSRVMKERRIPLLATAHHADDQLETVIFRLARGTLSHGLAGISPMRPMEGGYVVRPFLAVTRAQIEDYCARHEIEYVQDSTNEDHSLARNRIRHEVIPVLEELFSGASGRSYALTAQLREDDEYLCTRAEALLSECVSKDGILAAQLLDAPLPVRRRALRAWACERVGGLLPVQEEALLRLVSDATPNMEVALSGDLVCLREGGLLRITQRNRTERVQMHLPLRMGLQTLTEQWCSETERVDDAKKIHNSSIFPCIILKNEFDIITKGLYWRQREDGDVLYLRGMHRKLRRLQAQAGIPVRLRERLPLLCDGEGVLWAPFVGARDGVESDSSGLLIRLTGTEHTDFSGRVPMNGGIQ